MLSVTRKFEFAGAHYLPNHPGKCQNLHGHTWKVEVEIMGQVKKDTGMIIDFGDMKEKINPIIETFDHKCLNKVLEAWGVDVPPTAENLVMIFVTVLTKDFLNLCRVRIYESDDSYAEWKKSIMF